VQGEDLVSSTPIAVLYTHKKEELAGFLDKIPPYAKRKIDEVVIDLNSGYKNAIRKALPHVRIAQDPFTRQKTIRKLKRYLKVY